VSGQSSVAAKNPPTLLTSVPCLLLSFSKEKSQKKAPADKNNPKATIAKAAPKKPVKHQVRIH